MEKETHSGIYLLPNLFTTVSLFAAFYSLVASMKGQYEPAVLAILIGTIADSLDGRIARLTNTQTAFGAQYDSLSDLVTFGVAPSILLYQLTLGMMGKLGWLVAFIFTATVALRLARFNILSDTSDKRYFRGLPCPPAAAMICSFAWICYQNEWHGVVISIITALLMLLLSGLMISTVRYYSFKEIDFRGKVPFLYVLVMIVLFVAIAANPSIVLFVGTGVYVISGLVLTYSSLLRARQPKGGKHQ
jgi:CDP-diacylglycerol--serine O-phosphatidyltransferase